MFKAKHNLSPAMVKEIWPKSCNPYNPFKTSNVHSVYNGPETLIYNRGPKTWALIPEDPKKLHITWRILNAKLVNGNRCTCRRSKTYVSQVGFI